MEELRDIAKAHYEAGSPQVRSLAHQFFDSMDSNRDGRIELGEFLEFTRQNCHSEINSHSFFKKLDRDGKDTLDFWGVMTLYYIIKSGRPFCSYCKEFIPEIFFSCMGCSFTLCRGCYLSSTHGHNHNGVAQFLDNYTLLQVTRDSAHATGIKQDKRTTTSIPGKPTTPSIREEPFVAAILDLQTTTSIVPRHKEPTSTSIVPATTISIRKEQTTTSIVPRRKEPTSTSIVPATTISIRKEATTTSIRKEPSTTSIRKKPTTTSIVPTREEATTTSIRKERSTTSIRKKATVPSLLAARVEPSSTAIVRANEVNKWNVAFKALEVALAIGNISCTMCTIL